MSALGWTISTYCANGACVAVRRAPDVVQVRATGDPDVILSVPPAAWRAFIDGLKEQGREPT
jgi:hypothetical protein